MRSVRRHDRSHLFTDLFIGAVSGAAASYAMEKSQYLFAKLGTPKSLAAEAEAGKKSGEPATEKLVDRLATEVGVSLPDEQRKFGGELVHYATGTIWGAIFGAAMLDRKSRLGRAALFGALLWLIQDEILVPLLGLAGKPSAYPASSHAKALGAHLVYAESMAALGSLLH